MSQAKGPAGEVVRELGEAFRSIIAENWTEARDHLTKMWKQGAAGSGRVHAEQCLAEAGQRPGSKVAAFHATALHRALTLQFPILNRFCRSASGPKMAVSDQHLQLI